MFYIIYKTLVVAGPHARPTLRAVKSIVIVLSRSTALLQVTVSPVLTDIPNNAANRTWSGPSGIITTSNKFILSTDRYHLVVQDVGPNDTGLYTFTAANTLGSATVTIRLDLQGKQL